MPDENAGQVSLFFYKASSGPPPVPADGATITDTQPTLGLDAPHSGSFVYRLTDETTGNTYLGSPTTQNQYWTVPYGSALVPGHTYSWEVVDGNTNVQAARTFTIDASTQPSSTGVTMEMRSMNYFADSASASYLQPKEGQKVPQLSASSSIPSGCEDESGGPPTCYEYQGEADAPDDYGEYFTTETTAQAKTSPGAVDVDFDTFDPFGLDPPVQELFTLHITSHLTVPFTGDYTFGVDAFGGARLTLTDPDGNQVGPDPIVDSWGQVSNCSVSFRQDPNNIDEWTDVAKYSSATGCVNSNGTTVASEAVRLTAGTQYSLVVDGFMSWQPGPFELLYTSDVLASTMAPVPATWLTTTIPTLDQPYCGGLPATIVGTDGPDRLVGTQGDDVIAAGAGDDRVHGVAGDDTICGNDGNDVIRGQAGDDVIYGGFGDDDIRGGPGDDTITGDHGDDTIAGEVGNDIMTGGAGHDTITGTNGNRRGNPTRYRDDDHADGGDGDDRCLNIHPDRATSCERTT